MKMSLACARELLSVTEQDDPASLKKKYHRLMAQRSPRSTHITIGPES